MELSFAQQSAAFLWSVLLGVALGVVYGVFKFLRFAFSLGKVAIFALDALFMLLTAVAAFLFSLGFIRGYVRIYLFLGALAGFLAYRLTLGRLFFCCYRPVVRFCRKARNKLSAKIKSFSKKLLKNRHKILYNNSGKEYLFNNLVHKGNEYGIKKEKAVHQNRAGGGNVRADRGTKGS